MLRVTGWNMTDRLGVVLQASGAVIVRWGVASDVRIKDPRHPWPTTERGRGGNGEDGRGKVWRGGWRE